MRSWPVIAGVHRGRGDREQRGLDPRPDLPGRLGDMALAPLFQESDAWGLAVFTALTLVLLVTAVRR